MDIRTRGPTSQLSVVTLAIDSYCDAQKYPVESVEPFAFVEGTPLSLSLGTRQPG